MITGPLAKRYAKALADVAAESGLLESLRGDLSRLAEWMHESTELSSVMKNPSVPAQEKLTIFERIWDSSSPQRMPEPIRKFLQLLIQNHRMNMLTAIVQAYQEIVDQYTGTIAATIFSSIPLTVDQKTVVVNRLKGISGSQLRPDFQQDEDMIGGVIVKIGSTVYDGSVRNQLELVKRTLARESSA
jgi:F-type H+-transporting ATPase subunit delta